MTDSRDAIIERYRSALQAIATPGYGLDIYADAMDMLTYYQDVVRRDRWIAMTALKYENNNGDHTND